MRHRDMSEINSFSKGVRNGLPICFGYLSVAFAFGIFACGSGLTVAEALLISATNVTSAGQLAAVPIIAGGDVSGCVAFLADENKKQKAGEVETKLLQTAASFLGQQMTM